jgi:hypothetical protein
MYSQRLYKYNDGSVVYRIAKNAANWLVKHSLNYFKAFFSWLNLRKLFDMVPSADYPQKLALISPVSGCRSVGIVRSHTQATEFF